MASGLGESKTWDLEKSGNEGTFLIISVLHFGKWQTTPSRPHSLWCGNTRLETVSSPSPWDITHIPHQHGHKIQGAIAVNLS